MIRNTYELLDFEKVAEAVKPFKRGYVLEKMGISHTTASIMINHGILPSRARTKTKALEGLSELTGIPISELTMTLTRI